MGGLVILCMVALAIGIVLYKRINNKEADEIENTFACGGWWLYGWFVVVLVVASFRETLGPWVALAVGLLVFYVVQKILCKDAK